MDIVGIVCAFLSAVLMATIGVFSKFTGLSAEMVTFFRLFLGAFFMLFFLLVKKEVKRVYRWPTIPVIASGVFLAGFILFYVQAMNFTTMANAIMLVYLAPFAASVVAHFFLGERLSLMGFVFIVVALLGFAMMMEFDVNICFKGDEYKGLLFAACALFFYAGYILANRVIKEEIHVYTRTFWQLLIGACVAAPMAGGALFPIFREQTGWLVAIGFFPGFLAILCAVIALSRLPATLFGTLVYTEAVAVVIFGWFFFEEKLSLLQILGCITILLCGILRVTLAEENSKKAH